MLQAYKFYTQEELEEFIQQKEQEGYHNLQLKSEYENKIVVINTFNHTLTSQSIHDIVRQNTEIIGSNITEYLKENSRVVIEDQDSLEEYLKELKEHGLVIGASLWDCLKAYKPVCIYSSINHQNKDRVTYSSLDFAKQLNYEVQYYKKENKNINEDIERMLLL